MGPELGWETLHVCPERAHVGCIGIYDLAYVFEALAFDGGRERL